MRTKKNRAATLVLAAALLAAISAPAHAAGGWGWPAKDAAEAGSGFGLWSWLVSVWADRGVTLDPNGRPAPANVWGENGVAIDPNGAPQSAPNTAGAPNPHDPETH